MGVSAGTKIFFSPTLYFSVSVGPSTSVTTCAPGAAAIDPPVFSSPCNGRASSGLSPSRFTTPQFHETSVVAVIVAGPNPLPSPRCRLPAPARGAIEANAGDERRRGKSEEAAVVEPIEPGERNAIVEPGERKAIDARCKSRPEGEAA